jgi:hypothetical protein
VFTELLPREESWHDSCEQCERHVERREGPKAPRHYQFVARGIAEALQAVGAGDTYMQASRVARDRARRFRYDPEPARSVSRPTASSSPTGSSCLRRSSSLPAGRPRGRRTAR